MKNILNVLVSLMLLYSIAGCSGGLSAEFQEDYVLFVKAADPLEGVGLKYLSYAAFLVQLEEIQTHYNHLLAHKWPDQLSEANESFESAIHSLILVKEVWEVYNKGSGSWRCSLDRDVGNAVALTLKISERLDGTDESALKWLRSQTCDVIITDLMENFSFHFTAGKNEMDRYLKSDL
jgi:hypothetical protein